MTKRMLTIREVSELLVLSSATIYKLVDRGAIPHVRIKGSIRFPDDALRDWIEEKTVPARVVPDRRSTNRVRRTRGEEVAS